MRKPVTRTWMAVVATFSLGLAACGSDDDAATPESDEETDTEPDTDGAAAADASSQADPDESSADVPTIVVTTNILGDVVGEVVGDSAEVVTIMPVGADPHDFQASAQEVDAMISADALIVNGLAFEEGLLDVIENAEDEGVPTFEAASVVDTIEFGEGGHDHDEHSDEEHSDDEHKDEDHDEDHDHSDEEDHSDEDEDHDHSDEDHSDEDKDEDHSDEEHSDEDHSDEDKDEDHSDEDHSDEEHSDDEHSDDEHSDDEHDHDHSGDDPHFFTDPMRMAEAVEGIVGFLQAEIEFADPAALDAAADAYIAELTAVDGEIEELVAAIPEDGRILVTNHEVFGYFADRYGFEVAGAAIPSFATSDSASAGELAELAEVIEDEGVPAIFSDTSSSDELVQTLADEVGDIEVVSLYTESLGEPDSDGGTYIDMVRTNAERISGALA